MNPNRCTYDFSVRAPFAPATLTWSGSVSSTQLQAYCGRSSRQPTQNMAMPHGHPHTGAVVPAVQVSLIEMIRSSARHFFDTISLTGPLGKLPNVHTSYYSNFEMMTIPSKRHLLRVVIADACRRWEQAVGVPCPYDPYYTPQGRYEAFLRTMTVNQFEYSENALGVPLAYEIMIGRKPPSFPPETHDRNEYVARDIRRYSC